MKDIKNWSKIKGNQEAKAKKSCTVTVDHDRVNEIFEKYNTKAICPNTYLSNKGKKV